MDLCGKQNPNQGNSSGAAQAFVQVKYGWTFGGPRFIAVDASLGACMIEDHWALMLGVL